MEENLDREPEGDAWPAFLVGCHRSGTTLARYLLDVHPNLACPPESKFLAGLEAFLDYPQVETALNTLGFTEEEVLHELRKFIEVFLGGYARRNRKTRWIDKTPNYYRLLPFIDDIFAGEVLYLFIVRHPLDCIDSLHNTFYYATRYDDDPEIARSIEQNGKGRYGWAKYWNDVYERIYTFAMLHAGRCHIFKYEDLAADAAATMQRIFGFLGETCPANLVETALSMKHTPGYEDHTIRKTHAIRTDGVDKWRKWSPCEIEALWHLTGATAAKLGYEAPL